MTSLYPHCRNRPLGKLGFCLLGTDALAVRRKNSAREATGRAVARGMLVSLPLAFVFGGLLYSADATFERLVRNAVDVDLSTFGTTIIIFTIVLVAVAGILRRLLIEPETKSSLSPMTPFVLNPKFHSPYREPGPPKLGALEVTIVLGVLVALFGVFVALQVPYLFGGSHTIAKVPGLTVANYARRGFFELVTVVPLAIPNLVCLFGMLRHESGRGLRLLGFVLVGLLAIVAASAAHRKAFMSICMD